MVPKMVGFLKQGELPIADKEARRLAMQAKSFVIDSDVFYFIDSKRGNHKRAVLICSLKEEVLKETHECLFGQRTYNALSCYCWWNNMYLDTMEFCKICPHCAIVSGTERRNRTPPCPIPVQRPF